MPGKVARVGAKVGFAVLVFAVLALAIVSRPTKRLIDFDQSFYLTIAYDLERHGVFSNGPFDEVDSTSAAPPPGMFFSPLYPWLVRAVMRVDARFASAVACSIEANHGRRDLAGCDIYALPMQIVHALLLMAAVLAIAASAELIIGTVRAFHVAGILALIAMAGEAELFSYIMTESLWLSLFSLTMLAAVAALATARRRYFVLAGVLLGALCLARPSFLVVFPTLLAVLFAWAHWFSPRAPLAWARPMGLFVLAFLAATGSWLVRNQLSVGNLRFSEEYGSATLVERFAFNSMSLREFALAFPYCVPRIGPAVVTRLWDAGTMARFEWDQPASFFATGRERRMALVQQHGRLDPIIGDVLAEEMRRNGWRHLATTVPLGWCGLWVSGLWSLFVIPLFILACVDALRRARPLLLLYAIPAFVLVALHAAIANHYPRYNLGLIGPFSVGAAWMLVRGRRERLPALVEAESPRT